MSNKFLTITLQGGLGNQLFQFANGYVISKANNMKLKIDISGYRNSINRQFELNKFTNVKKVIFSDNKYFIYLISKILRKIFYLFFFIRTQKFESSPFVFNRDLCNYAFSKNTNLIGYFQSEKYFMHKRSEILQLFQFSTNKSRHFKFFFNKINYSNAVALHLRGGDYITNPKAKNYHGNLPQTYYSKSIDYISKEIYNPHFFIFTDDIHYFNQISYFKKFKYTLVDIKSAFDSLHLMSLCKHHIIANSSFSWWGAWLCTNKKKIVCTPRKWVRIKIKTTDVVPRSWKKI